MSKFEYKTTKQIEEEYGVTRQTLHNWISEGILKSPRKDFRNWFCWTLEDELNLKKIIEKKEEHNNKFIPKENEELLISNRRYLGSKQKLIDFINEVVENNTSGISTVADIFAGTGVVADYFRSKGKKIIVNDILKSNVVAYKAWFGNETVDLNKIRKIIRELNSVEVDEDNYVSINFGNKYFSMENARKIGYIREKIDIYNVNDRERAVLLTSLIYAMDKVANTVGHYDAYRKKMDSYQPIYLKVPKLEENKENLIYCEDANELVKRISADLVYIDTPYNSRQYGDAYHLLENIVNWEKPSVVGVAKKMADRSKTKSVYSTKKAPEAFDDLIQNIKAKYILVSYNNMAQKGVGRSNAKISNDEIIYSLEKRGKVTKYEIPFKVFTTGKTNIEDHKEILYLCTIKQSQEYVKSPINYSGGKYKLLKQILPHFPENISTFYDVFAGGANVAINVKADKIVINDIEKHVIELFKYFRRTSIDQILEGINDLVSEYKLSNTRKYGYEYYGVNSAAGLKSINEKSFLKLRNDFNNEKTDKDANLVFYVLLVYAFNNQVRFNKSGEFNIPPGKRDFNEKMENKLKSFKMELDRKNIKFESKDFRELLNRVSEKDSFVYLDPPYLISRAAYNENGGWTEQDEIDLLKELDILNEKGIKFALSNVLSHKGKENRIIKEWASKYNLHYLDFNYNNSNYQTKARQHKTEEVLITNY